MLRLKPSEIMFSQDSINNHFDKRSLHSNILIGETLDDICEGRCSVFDIPTINVMKRDGKWVTADNRRLWVFRQLERLGKCDGILVRETFYIDPAKLNSYNGGVSVRVRRYAGGRWHNKPSVVRSTPKVNFAINSTPTNEARNVPSPVIKPLVTKNLNSITLPSTTKTWHSTYSKSRHSNDTALNSTISVKNEIQPTPYRKFIEPSSSPTGAPHSSTAVGQSQNVNGSYGRTPSSSLGTGVESPRSHKTYSVNSSREPFIYHDRRVANYGLESQNVQGPTTTISTRNATVYPSYRASDSRGDGFLDRGSLRENVARTDRRDDVRVDMRDDEPLHVSVPDGSCPCVIL